MTSKPSSRQDAWDGLIHEAVQVIIDCARSGNYDLAVALGAWVGVLLLLLTAWCAFVVYVLYVAVLG